MAYFQGGKIGTSSFVYVVNFNEQLHHFSTFLMGYSKVILMVQVLLFKIFSFLEQFLL